MSSNYQYFISRNGHDDTYKLWTFDMGNPSLFEEVAIGSGNTIPKDHQLIQVGNYLLEWSTMSKKTQQYSFNLFEFNANEQEPLGSYGPDKKWCAIPVQSGVWSKKKFFGSRVDFANPDGADKGFNDGTALILVAAHNFVLNWIPTEGRGTYQLYHFDHGSDDPLPSAITQQGAWLTIEEGHELMYCCGYVIDRKTATGDFCVWQLDAQDENPLSFPAYRQGNWSKLGITPDHKLIVMGQYILQLEIPNKLSQISPMPIKYRLWVFDPEAEHTLVGPVKEGVLPKEITYHTSLTAIETLIPVNDQVKGIPGTMDFMRDKIEHVVYYMLENRSFDHVCGWLYSIGAPIKVIGQKGDYRGVDPKFTNTFRKKEYAITQYNDGKLSDKITLDLDKQDPYHDYSDVMRQMFFKDISDYYKRKTPDMGGFACNNGTKEVMLGYSPEQLPVLNGLAKHFAISDDWFCAVPGGTDTNRAFALTGSTLGKMNNFQNGTQYAEWADRPHRPSIWKVLWSNGMNTPDDFKIYNAVEWMNCKFTYNLFLKGQIPSIDNPITLGGFCPQLNQFYDDLKYNTLPKFSFLEPKWVASAGSTSYHPGNDLIPGERTLNDLFNALQSSPAWGKTLMVITFDEHGGLADHVPPPYTVKPFVNERIEDFSFDIMGPRIPTILISPWITENTVFRTENGEGFDSTSILATLLQWLGIPQSKWGLGERVNHAPTFEAVVRESEVRTDKITLQPPWDALFPKEGAEEGKVNGDLPIHGLHDLVVPRMIADMTPTLSQAERAKITEEILNAKNQAELHEMLTKLDAMHSLPN